jgi:hypothetical protein
MNMSLFKQYIAESVKTYNFKIKIAGDLREDMVEQMNSAMVKYDCDGVGKGKRTPIQEAPLDFPEMKNTHVTIFDVSCRYPVTSHVLTQYLAEKLKISASCIRVRSPGEEAETELNSLGQKRIGTSTEALLNQPYENADNQNLVGEKAKLSFLQELGKIKHEGEVYKGINDELLAKSVPSESPPKENSNIGTTSPIGSTKTAKNVDPYKGKTK